MEEKKNEKPGVWSKLKKVLIGIGTVLLGIFLFRRCNLNGRGVRRALDTNRQLRDELERERQADEREAGRIESERGRVVRENIRVEAERKRLAREGELSGSERKSVSTARDILERAKARTEQSKNSQRS